MRIVFSPKKNPVCCAHYLGIFMFILVGVSIHSPVFAQGLQGEDPAAHPDSTQCSIRPVQSYWGMIQAPADSNSAVFENRPPPTWEKIVMVPHAILGVPFRLLYLVGDRTINFLDDIGAFGLPPAEYAGLPAPFGTYLMPLAGIDGLEGITYGMSIHRPELFGKEHEAFMVLESSTKHAERIAGGLLFKVDDIWELQVGAGRQDTPLTKYYGVGLRSYKGDLSYYERISNWGGFELDRDIGHDFSLELRSFFSRVEAKGSRYETQLALAKIHEGNLPPGFDGTSSGWNTGLSIIHDGTDQTGRPDHSGFQKFGLHYFTATDGHDLSFLSYHVDVEHFVPLWFTKRALGLRIFHNKIDNVGTESIPLTRMVTFKNPDGLRGYESLRFYGLGSLGLSAEYRWPVWVTKGREGPGLDAYIYSDVGQVFNQYNEVKIGHMDVSGGLGLRLIGDEQDYAARIEVGISNEGTIYRLKFSQTFQYEKKGFLYGKDPTRLH